MFLDDHLYSHTKSKKIQKPDDFKDLVNELYRICEDHYKPLLIDETNSKAIKACLDRTFKSWDIFIDKLKKENWIFIDILGRYDVSYKSVFLSNDQLKQIYNTL